MSTFFRSAAMSLLSRTLQTLLSKYLSDVDVEGVNLPSLYSSEGHSGWGVRLSNVKLREGAKLLDLPGKPQRRRRKKRRKTKTEKDEPNKTQEEAAEIRDKAKGEDNIGDASAEKASETPEEAPARSSWFFWSSSSKVEDKKTETTQDLNPLEGYLGDSQSKIDLSSSHGGDEKVGALLSENPETANGPDQGEEDEFEDEEDDEDDLPMVLRLGKGGSIGTLDVRLVGKDIHVFVEDADLTVEMAQLSPDLEAEEKDADTDGKKKKKAPKPPPEIKTVGDRVLAENAIARAMSLIPNLLLRDIRVTVVMRDEVVTPETEDGFTENDSIVELAIELLSVTDGADFLARYRMDDDDSSSGEESEDERNNTPVLLNPSESEVTDDNEYLTKRIRTGRGADGGIVLRVFPPRNCLGNFDTEKWPGWARTRYLSASESCLLRCPGLDAQVRIFMGTREEVGYAANDEYEEYTVDAMLFGIDYVVPGPKPPLPPMEAQGGVQDDKIWTYEGATRYQLEDNGIRSCGVSSSFHRAARGLTPFPCEGEHLPCEYCSKCWHVAPGSQRQHALDSTTPMSGLVFNFSMRDPLEVNVDRSSLDVIGVILGLFRSPPATRENLPDGFSDRHVSFGGIDDSERTNTSALSHTAHFGGDNAVREVPSVPMSKTDDSSFSSASRLSSLEGRPSLDRARSDHSQNSKSTNLRPDTGADYAEPSDVSEAYPAYMQPEFIQILGLHLPEVRFRVHVMKGASFDDIGGSFFYWDMAVKCLTMDHQKLSAPQKGFQDFRFDCGHIQLREYKGVDRKLLASFGLRQKVVEFDEVTVETLLTEAGENMRPPWPSTASALLDVQPPLETLMYEPRDRHALQMRFLCVCNIRNEPARNHSLFDVRVGAMSVGAEWKIKADVFDVIDSAKTMLFGPPKSVDSVLEPVDLTPPIKSCMKFKLRLDGGQLRLEPLLDIQLPLTQVVGEKSSASGLSFETLLEHVLFNYGNTLNPPVSFSKSLSLQALADLPENVRLRVLLFIKDLSPFETALGLRSEENSFLRCRAVNRQIVKLARRKSRRVPVPSGGDEDTVPRRQELLTDIMKLDDETLEDLWLFYQRDQRKTGRKKMNR